jgi:predicted nucleotidyltransferase
MTTEGMKKLMQESKLTLSSVYTKLKLTEKDVTHVYLVGSRLWGTANSKSDYDFIIVHSKWPKEYQSIHNSEIDATVLHSDEFQRRLEEHEFYETITQHIPKEYVWKEAKTKKVKFDAQALCKSVIEETNRDWTMAQKYFEKSNSARGKKTIVHALRLLLISIQLVEKNKNGGEIDLCAALQYSNASHVRYSLANVRCTI